MISDEESLWHVTICVPKLLSDNWRLSSHLSTEEHPHHEKGIGCWLMWIYRHSSAIDKDLSVVTMELEILPFSFFIHPPRKWAPKHRMHPVLLNSNSNPRLFAENTLVHSSQKKLNSTQDRLCCKLSDRSQTDTWISSSFTPKGTLTFSPAWTFNNNNISLKVHHLTFLNSILLIGSWSSSVCDGISWMWIAFFRTKQFELIKCRPENSSWGY